MCGLVHNAPKCVLFSIIIFCIVDNKYSTFTYYLNRVGSKAIDKAVC